MERVVTSKNQHSLYFSLRFELNDSFKNLFCLDCSLYREACFIVDKTISNRIVGRIDLHHPQITEEEIRKNLQISCGDISELLE